MFCLRLTWDADFLEVGDLSCCGECPWVVACSLLQGVAALGCGRRGLESEGEAAGATTVTLLQALDGDAQLIPGTDLVSEWKWSGSEDE